MEKLSVYEDYLQSMAFLHASRNRLVNAVETSRLTAQDGQFIIDSCQQIYKAHTQRGCEKVDSLKLAVQQRQAQVIESSMKALHKHNRQTMRISKVFEDDVSDVHPDPDAPIDENAPKVPANLVIPLSSSKMKQKLQNLLTGS
jgi:phosphoribosylformylglycinamidine (FGAM) synthase PurS component